MMNETSFGLPALFSQLGLPDDDAAIDAFIARHGPLEEAIRLAEAPFWTPAQARFLAEAKAQDSDWCAAFETLNARLRAGR